MSPGTDVTLESGLAFRRTVIDAGLRQSTRKYNSIFLGTVIFLFGFLKFFEPFKTWFHIQIANSGLPPLSIPDPNRRAWAPRLVPSLAQRSRPTFPNRECALPGITVKDRKPPGF